MSPLLSVSNLHVKYGAITAVSGVSLEVGRGEIRVLLGANGAGKSTITRSILGLHRAHEGTISFDGRNLVGLPAHKVHQHGISWVPQGRQVWASMTVEENLRLGSHRAPRAEFLRRLDEVFQLFPALRTRRSQLAGSMSGGEQQMVAIARALVSKPKLVLMDEPTLGLAPRVITQLFDLVREMRAMGISVLMAEQNARQALKVADWGYVLEGGRVVASAAASELATSGKVQEVYLGGGT